MFDTSTTFIIYTGSIDHLYKEANLFIGKISPCPKIDIKGIGGQLHAKGYGTIWFKLIDDHGKTNELTVHNVLYVPNSPVNLFSPQKFARDDEVYGISGTCLLTGGTNSHFIQNNSKYIKIIHYPLQESLPILHVNEGFNATALFSTCPNPLVCQAVSDLPPWGVSFDDKVDAIITMLSEQNPRDSTGPAVIEDASDDLSECSLDVQPLPLNDSSSLADSLPNVEEDVDDMATVTSADDPELVDAKDDEQDDPDIPQLNQSDLERLKSTMTAPLSPSQNEFLQWHVRLQHLPFTQRKRLTKKGMIPPKFSKMSNPMCP